MQTHRIVLGAIARLFTRIGALWSRFWFVRAPTTPLELVRIGTGAAMFAYYCLAAPYLLDFWGDNSLLMPRAVVDRRDPWQQSIFFYFSDPSSWVVFHVLFLLACLALMLGWRTAVVKW